MNGGFKCLMEGDSSILAAVLYEKAASPKEKCKDGEDE